MESGDVEGETLNDSLGGRIELLRVLRKAVQNMQLGIVVTDTEGHIVFVNPAQARMHGYEVEEMVGQDVSILAPPELKRPMSKEEVRRVRTWSRESVNRRKDGTLFPVMLLSDLVQSSNGEPLGIVTTAEDITERRRVDEELRKVREGLEERVRERTLELRLANEALTGEIAERAHAARALKSSEARYRQLFERNLAAVCRTDLYGTILEGNESFARLLGFARPDEVAGRSLTEFTADVAGFQAASRKVQVDGALFDLERSLVRRDGSAAWVLENASLLVDDEGRAPSILRTAVDITGRKKAEDQLLHDAFHDSLTGLANRALFLDRLRQMAARARRHGSAFAVLFADLDRFKLVNDSYGHDTGDRLLVAIAARLGGVVRGADTIARLGGDEFTFLLEDITSVADATQTAERVQEALSQSFQLGDQEVFVGASIGITVGGPDTVHPDDLLRDADVAMYRAKALGKARYEVFDPAMRESAVLALQVETELRRAVERGELRLHYQPIVSLPDGSLTGFEALARWQHPQRGLVLPAEFIPIAEETGLISWIGAWVLEEACLQLRSWQDRFPAVPPLTMSVNLSSRQFSNGDLLRQIEGALQKSGIDPSTLTLEITESLLIENAETATALLERVRSLGVELSLDDFGTGYSSLSYLHRLPLQKLKIDKSFLDQAHTDRTKSQIVRAVAQLAETLNLEVIAEGVEAKSSLDLLEDIPCGSAQGFYFSKPVDAVALEAMLASGSGERGGGPPGTWSVRLPAGA